MKPKSKYLDILKQNTLYERKQNKKNKKNDFSSFWWEKHGNTSSWANIIVGVVVAIFTLLLFNQAQKQNRISEKNMEVARISAEASKISADAAIKSVNLSDSLYQLTKQSFKSNDNNFVLQLKVAQASALASQILAQNAQKGLAVSQKNFEIASKPYILVANLSCIVDTLSPPRFLQVVSIFFNYGNTPALVTKNRKGVLFSDKLVLETFPFLNPKSELNNYIKANGQFNDISTVSLEKLQLDYHYFKQGKLFIYTFGELYFNDIITQKKYIYKYCIRVNSDGSFIFNKFHNDVIFDSQL